MLKMCNWDKEKMSKLGFREDFDWDNRFDLKTTVGDYTISTVDLGLNHNFSGIGDPLYYETMVFKDNTDDIYERWNTMFSDIQRRYPTEEKAKEGHQEIVELVKLILTEHEAIMKELDGDD